MANFNGNAALEKWIREAIADEREGNPCRAIACVHKEGARDVEVYTVTFTPDKVWKADDLASLFEDKAKDHVAEIPGTQLFFLYAFYGISNEPRARRSFRVNNSDVDFGYGTTEPPTPQGQLMQAMRHAEASNQFSFRHTQYLIEAQYKMFAKMADMNTALMKENVEAINLAKVTILERAENDKQRIVEEAKKGERIELMKMLPPLVNRALGQEVFPQSTADSKLLETLLGNIDEKMVQQLAGVLKPEVMGLLAARAAQYHEEKNRAEKTAEKVAIEKSNGASVEDEFNN